MNYKKMLEDLGIEKLSTDSRNCGPNSMFFCIEGVTADRHDFVDDAIKNGAIAIVHSKKIDKVNGIEYLLVSDVYKTLEDMTLAFYDYPSKKMNIFGVTGTNGKSTITSTLRHVLNRLDEPTGYVGTISIEYGDVVREPSLTTPDVVEMNDILNDMYMAGMKSVALEVSSQGLDLNRVDTIDFDCAIFTNLSPEHLDYHKDMEDYYQAKKHLFEIMKKDSIAIINIDDPYGKRLYNDLSLENKFSVSLNGPADYMAQDIVLHESSSSFTLINGEEKLLVETNVVAKFNIYNLIQVIAAVHQKGYPLRDIVALVRDLPIVKGRVNFIEEGQRFNAVVDYSHTPDGFEKIYQYLRSITENRLICVYGNAGGRDQTKRPVMGEISDKYCDLIVITEQDRRTEDIESIKNMMVQRIEKTPYVFIPKRFEAIEYALNQAEPGDTVVVLGKGDERFQHGPKGKEPWPGDDEAVKMILKEIVDETK